MIIKNTFYWRWYSTSVKKPKKIWKYLCFLKIWDAECFEILPFNGEHFWRWDISQEVHVLFWSELKKPKLNYNSYYLDSHIHSICSDCGIKHTKNKEHWQACTFYKWVCQVCQKEKLITSVRNYGYPDFTNHFNELWK